MREVGQFLTRLRRSCVLVRPLYTVSVSPDDSDNRFLECAEAANADFLVTGNKRHFPKRWKETEVVNARELLGKIGSTFLK
jgi:predicted nucleic acid-binding protein